MPFPARPEAAGPGHVTAGAKTIDIVDNGFGPLALEPVRDYLQRRSSLTSVDLGPAARWTQPQWLISLRGRQRAFWLPTWGRELVLQAPVAAGGTSMVVAPIADLTAYVGRHFMFDLPSGPIFREITGAVFDALGHRLDTAQPGVAVPLETPIHFMTKVRPRCRPGRTRALCHPDRDVGHRH